MTYTSLLCVISIISILLPTLKFQFSYKSEIFDRQWVFIIVSLASALNGIGQGVNQVSIATYIQGCANEKNKGFFYSIYWSMTMGSIIIGNLISAIFIDKTNQSTLIICMAIICLVSIMGLPYLFLYEKKPVVIEEEEEPFAHEQDLT